MLNIVLQAILSRLLDDVVLAVQQGLWFQHDGDPPHYGENVREWLDTTYPERWIGEAGPTAWPPQSLDLCWISSYGYT